MSPKNSKTPKTPKKRSDAAAKELKAIVAKLRAELEKAESRASRLKEKVGVLEAGKAELEKQVRKLTKKLAKASSATPAAPPAAATAPAAPPSDVPGPSWTVAQLRSEVEARGITGVPSRATKAQLLAVLAPADD